jgi:hypothetical protein
MGMFDFFKKKPVEDKGEVESLTYKEAEKVFEERSEALKKREGEVLLEIGDRLEEFYVSVEKGLDVLEGVDLESKKEHERAKILVRQGLDKYVGFVRVLLKDLRRLDRDDLRKFVREVGGVFVGFEKGSAKFYERATYLIGDEMMAVRNEIRRFYNGLLNTFEEERGLIGNLKRVEKIELKLGEIEGIGEKLGGFEREASENDKGVDDAKNEVERLKGEVEVIRGSEEYASRLKVAEEVEGFERGFNAEIVKLKGMIDFKRLIGIVHSNERELGIVKGYRERFVLEFSRDSGRLIGILSDCSMMSSEIKEQVALVSKLKGELSEKRESVGVDVSVGKLEEVKKIEGKIEEMEIGRVKVRQRVGEFEEKLDGLKEDVVWLVREMGKV